MIDLPRAARSIRFETWTRRYKYRPSFKDWASMAVAKDLNYTPRTLYALGALMDVSKTDLDRAKTKSIKIFPAGTLREHPSRSQQKL